MFRLTTSQGSAKTFCPRIKKLKRHLELFKRVFVHCLFFHFCNASKLCLLLNCTTIETNTWVLNKKRAVCIKGVVLWIDIFCLPFKISLSSSNVDFLLLPCGEYMVSTAVQTCLIHGGGSGRFGSETVCVLSGCVVLFTSLLWHKPRDFLANHT